MSGFGFSEAQEMFRREVREFARREIAPGSKKRAKQEFIDRELVKKVADQGLIGLTVAEKYGGQGADWVTTGIAIEELSKTDFAIGNLPSNPGVLDSPISPESTPSAAMTRTHTHPRSPRQFPQSSRCRNRRWSIAALW